MKQQTHLKKEEGGEKKWEEMGHTDNENECNH